MSSSSLLGEVNGSAGFLKLLQKKSDAFEASAAVGNVFYEKKEGKKKPCVLALTMVNCYVLKGDKTLKPIAMFALGSLTTRFGADGRLLMKTPEELFPLWGDGVNDVNAALTAMREQGARLQASTREAAEAARSSGEEDGSHDDHSLSNSLKRSMKSMSRGANQARHADPLSGGPGGGAAGDGTPAAGDDANADGNGGDSPGAGGRQFLINNIVSADFIDYSAIRSIYPLRHCAEEENSSKSASRALVAQLKDFIDNEQGHVERVVCGNSQDFLTSIEECEALQPEETASLHDYVAEITARVYETAQALHDMGQDVVDAEAEYELVKSSLQQTRLCQAAASLHRKAETLVAERKYYPALVAAQELEEQTRGLLSHAYGRWVFHEALPNLRQRIRQQVQYDFNAWLTTARNAARSFGSKALEWAGHRIKASIGTERSVIIVENDVDEDGTTSGRHHHSSRGGGSRNRSLRLGGGGASVLDNLSFADDQTEDAAGDDWAQDLLWEVESQDLHGSMCSAAGDAASPAQSPAQAAQKAQTQQLLAAASHPHVHVGAAQFLESLSDEIINPPEGPALKVVHTAMRVFQTLDPLGGEALLQKYYTDNRKRQLALTLESLATCEREKDWLAGITGFFLVDLVVARSTHPPLSQKYQTQGAWDDAVLCVEKWMTAAQSKYTSWKQLDWIKTMGLQVAVALEELWAVGGDTNLRVDPIHEALSQVRRCAMKELHINTMRSIDAVLSTEAYQLITAMPKPEQYKRLMLHLAASGEDGVMPKCSVTVPNVIELLLNTMDIAFDINRGAGDVDDEVRGLVDSLLQHIASQLDERCGKLGRTNTLHISILSANAGTYDAAVLSLARKYASKASSVYVHDGRLNLFAASRRRFRDCQRRFESRAAGIANTQVTAYLSALSSDMWLGKRRGPSPLVDLQVEAYLQNNWTMRKTMLGNSLCARMKQVELDAVDSHLVSLAAALHLHSVQPVVELQKDVLQLRNALSLPLPKFDAKVKSLIQAGVGGLGSRGAAAAAAIPPRPESPASSTATTTRRGFFSRSK